MTRQPESLNLKKNKAAAEKSLEAERDNLSRVNDILYELEKQVGPLKSQSETAKKYLLLKNELKKLDVNAFFLEMEQLKKTLDKDTADREILDNDLRENKEALEHTKEEYERIEKVLEDINSAIDTSKNRVS